VSTLGLHAGELVVDLDVFQGPFDLLVTLVLREEVDLWEVSVSRIIADYVLRLAESHEFDLEATSQFVVLVAALLEMKSRLLLDLETLGEDEEITVEEAGEELFTRLLSKGGDLGHDCGLGYGFGCGLGTDCCHCELLRSLGRCTASPSPEKRT